MMKQGACKRRNAGALKGSVTGINNGYSFVQ